MLKGMAFKGKWVVLWGGGRDRLALHLCLVRCGAERGRYKRQLGGGENERFG